MTLTQLEYMVALAKFKNFSKAAEACGVTQPSLSAQVAKLEKELGLYLFERGREGVRPTEAGREMVERAREILRACADLRQSAGFLKSNPRGTLRLGVIPTIAPFLLPAVMGPFAKTYPEVRVEIFEDNTETLVGRLRDDAIDVAILSTPKKLRGNFFEKFLYHEPFVVYAAQGHPLLTKKTIPLKSLESWHPVLLDETHCLRGQVESICARGDANEFLRIRHGTLPTLLSVVEVQKSFTLVPLLMAEALSQKQSRQVRPIVSPAPVRKVSLLYHGSFVARPLLQALYTVIKEHLPASLSGTSRRSEKVISPLAEHF